MSDRYFLMNEIPSIGIDTRDGRTRILVGVRSEHWGPTVAHSDDLGQTWIEPERGAIRFGAERRGGTVPGLAGLDSPDIEVILPRALTAEADGQRRLRVPCDRAITVRDLLAEITTHVPLLGRRLLDETGQLRRFVNLYVEGEDVRRSAELDTPIGEGQKVQIIQSVAGS
ncbi:MAG: hypothetical protein QOE89_4150 [Pseudonocardiales bacterium]|nr:hypothetical protein [Pseudonocardiales bacterium]